MQKRIDNREVGPLFTTERVHVYAALMASGHKLHRYEVDQDTNRMVFYFASANAAGVSIQDTMRDYANHDLTVDAKTLIDNWNESRDMIRNKGCARGKTKTQF